MKKNKYLSPVTTSCPIKDHSVICSSIAGTNSGNTQGFSWEEGYDEME